MDTTLHDLLRRSRAIPPRFAQLADGVRRAISLAEQDAEAALIRCRKVLERVVRRTFERRVGEPAGTRPLENLIQRLAKDGHVPRRVVVYANGVRELGNIGAHDSDSDRDEPVGVPDVAYAVDQLLMVIDWYMKEEPAGGPADAEVAGGTERPRTEVPALLPYLCDRSDQEDQLREALSNQALSGDGRPIVCVIHGDEDQSHDKFLERVRLRLLPQILGLDAGRGGARQYPVECPTDASDPSRFRVRLLSKLADRVVGDPQAPFEKVAGALACQPGPVLVRTHLMTDDWILAGHKPFEEFRRFWANWPGSGPKNPLLACLVVTYRLETGMAWFERVRLRRANAALNQFLRRLETLGEPGLHTLVLAELLGVTRSDAINWAHQFLDRGRFEGRSMPDEVARVFDRISGTGLGSRVAMRPLATALETLLRETAIGWEV